MTWTDAAEAERRASHLERFLHELSAPLSALALELERASRAAARGEDPSEALAAARRTLDDTFALFERGRQALLVQEVPAEEARPGP